LDRDIAVIDITGLAQTFEKSLQFPRVVLGRGGIDKSDPALVAVRAQRVAMPPRQRQVRQ
jgi:hypothetical protein